MRHHDEIISAAAQRERIESVLLSIEQELLDASGNPGTFQGLANRRASLQRELTRLGYKAKAEAAEAEQQHKVALAERLSDLRRRAAEQHEEAAALNDQMRAYIDKLVAIAKAAQAIGSAVEKLARQEDVALTVLHRAGIKVEIPRPTISSAGLDRDLALRAYAAGHAILRSAGIKPDSAAASTAVQHLHKL